MQIAYNSYTIICNVVFRGFEDKELVGFKVGQGLYSKSRKGRTATKEKLQICLPICNSLERAGDFL